MLELWALAACAGAAVSVKKARTSPARRPAGRMARFEYLKLHALLPPPVPLGALLLLRLLRLLAVVGDQRSRPVDLAVLSREVGGCPLGLLAEVFRVFEQALFAALEFERELVTGTSGTASKVLRIPPFLLVSILPARATSI